MRDLLPPKCLDFRTWIRLPLTSDQDATDTLLRVCVWLCFSSSQDGFTRNQTHCFLISPVTKVLRQLVGIRIRVLYHQKKQQLPCPALHGTEINTTGHRGLPRRTRMTVSSVNNPKSRVKWWEGTRRWWDKPNQSPEVRGALTWNKRGENSWTLGDRT